MGTRGAHVSYTEAVRRADGPKRLRFGCGSALVLLLATVPFRLARSDEANSGLAATPRVIVTGTDPGTSSLTSPDIGAARDRLQTVPGAVSVDDSVDLQHGRGAYLEDFLRYQPGVIIQSAQGSEDTKLSIRGSGVQNDDIIGVSLLIDGVPLNQADGEAFLHDVDLQSVKYAEVYRGADALRYGGVSLGGALNLVTVTGRDADPFTARLSFGSFGFYEQQATSGWAAERWDAYGSVVEHVADGFRDHSQENYQKVFLSLGYRINDAAENRLYFFYGRLDQNNPSGLSKDDLSADPRQTDPESIAEDWSTRWNYERVVDRFVINNADSQFQLALSWNHRQQTQRQEYEDDYRLGATRYYSDDYGADLAYENTADLFKGHNRLSLGIIPTFEPESDSSYADADGNLGALLTADRTYYLNLPFYLENQHNFTRTFSLLTGFQAVYVNRVFKDRFKSPTLGDQSHDDHFLAFNPKLGVAYRWNEQSLIYVNASRSFQPPSFDESLGIQEGVDGGEVFHDLHSQHAITLELGTRGKAGPFQWDVAFYRSWVSDELLDQNNAQGEPLGTINAPRTIHQGIEAGLETELLHAILVHSAPVLPAKDAKASDIPRTTDRLILEQTYTFSDFRFDDNPVYGTHRVAATPVHFYKSELRYEHPSGFYIGTNVEWNVVKYPVDEANSLFAEPYALLGLRVGYQTRKGVQLSFEAKNLTNKVYAATVEPLGDARSSDDTGSFNPGNGRAFYGGVSWVW